MIIGSTTIISTLQADGSGNAEIILNMAKIKITKEELEDLYWNQELSTRDIANKLGVGQTTIRRWLAKYDIKTRTSKEAKQTSVYLEKQEELAQRYRTEYIKDYTKFCEYCGKEFHVNGRHKEKKCCSEECARNLISRKLTKNLDRNSRINENGDREYLISYTCEICSKTEEFWNPYYYKKRFCNECLSKHKSDLFTNKIKTTCGNCGKEIEVIPSRFYNNKYCYCNVKCMAEHYAQIYTGENSPTWNGGKYHYKGNWLHQAKLCRERDNNVCQICGKTAEENGKNMDVHHIKPYKSFKDPTEANQLDNLVSLCHHCHRFVHSNSNIDKVYIKENNKIQSDPA